MKFTAIMPAYMKEDVIKIALFETEKVLKTFGMPYEIIVVDDGSKDQTRKKASGYKSKHVKVVGYKKNRGKGAALKYGFKYAKGDLIAFIDADTDLRPDQLEHFLYYMSIADADVVIGSKVHPYSKVKYPPVRRFLSGAYRTLNRILFNLDVHDTQVGQKVFKRKVLEDILPRVLVKRYAFDLELLVNAHHRGYKIVEAPITLNYDFSQSAVNLRAIWHIFVDTCAIFYRLRILHYYNGRKK
ncbi:MAG: glycosyltransferase [archaeon]